MAADDINRFEGEFEFLSNFSTCRIEFRGRTFPTVEHAYQSAKTDEHHWIDAIRQAPTPAEAKKLGRKSPVRSDWEEVKEGAMIGLLREKFTNEMLRSLLVATGDRKLIEGNWWGDRYWGVHRGEGLNRLGELLMQVRKEIASVYPQPEEFVY
jgi:hypothetical protein